MKDINDIMPKVPNMKWGALMNKPPTNEKFIANFIFNIFLWIYN
jgi:hypothetical protein